MQAVGNGKKQLENIRNIGSKSTNLGLVRDKLIKVEKCKD